MLQLIFQHTPPTQPWNRQSAKTFLFCHPAFAYVFLSKDGIWFSVEPCHCLALMDDGKMCMSSGKMSEPFLILCSPSQLSGVLLWHLQWFNCTAELRLTHCLVEFNKWWIELCLTHGMSWCVSVVIFLKMFTLHFIHLWRSHVDMVPVISLWILQWLSGVHSALHCTYIHTALPFP